MKINFKLLNILKNNKNEKNIFILLFFSGLFSLGGNAQSIFVPEGFTSKGIGTSTETGNVGIGVSNPSEELFVFGGNIGTSGLLKAGGNAYLAGGVLPVLSFNGWWNGTSDVFLTNGYASQWYYDTNVGKIIFRNSGSDGPGTTHDKITWSYPFTITKEGLVSINQLNPNTCPSGSDLKLFVNGTIGAKEVKVSLTNWCDYVFNKDYQLKSLKEVDAYIQAHKHLPEVPTEKEVLENGIAMGEIMKIQMKKIEELTLYMIELQKQNEKLAAEVAKLKK